MTPVLNKENRFWCFLFAAAPFAVLAGLALSEYIRILAACGGKFIYSLDDPYIHLALAEQIASGGYGINPGEAASPSSSALWPFLLTPFAGLSWFELVPLLVNLLVACATLYVYTQIAALALVDLPPRLASAFASWSATLLILASNLVGLAFTGMEHTLQVFLCAAIVWGLGITFRIGKPPRWLVYALAVAPWVRYECLAIVFPAALVLLLRGHWKTALAGLGGGLAGLAAFSFFLQSQDLAWLPASVLAKSGLVSPTGDASRLWQMVDDHLRTNLDNPGGARLAYAGLGLAALAVFYRGNRLLALFGALAAWLHLAAGQFGWWDRYEVYIVTTILLVVLLLARPLFALMYQHLSAATVAILIAALALPSARQYTENFLRTPMASANIYEQQYQMHRFTVDYLKAPVAVNDLGWVAFHNPHYVLDLWGLASLEALRLHNSSGGDPAWMDTLARQHDIRVAMVYDTWFGEVPRSWVRVARLRLGKPQASAGGDTVTFYVLDPGQVSAVKRLLVQFRPTLPPGVPLEIDP